MKTLRSFETVARGYYDGGLDWQASIEKTCDEMFTQEMIDFIGLNDLRGLERVRAVAKEIITQEVGYYIQETGKTADED